METQLYHYYYYNRRTNNHKTLSVEFLDDRVHGYIFSLNWPGETTDFDLNQKTAVIPGKTTKAEVIAIFGEPAGMMVLPTHLFGLTTQQLMQQKGAIKCIRYEYAHMNAGKGSGILYTKYVTFYIDNRDRVIDFVVTNTFP